METEYIEHHPVDLPWWHITVHAKDGYPYSQNGPAVIYDAAYYRRNGGGVLRYGSIEIYADPLPNVRFKLGPVCFNEEFCAPNGRLNDSVVFNVAKNARVEKIRYLRCKTQYGCLLELNLAAMTLTTKKFRIHKSRTHGSEKPHDIDTRLGHCEPQIYKTTVTELADDVVAKLLARFAWNWVNNNIVGCMTDMIRTMDESFTSD